MSTSDQLSPPAAPIPVTVLTGFLGAGKTTLLNHLLQHNPGEKIAIIENEFGEINLDSQLLKGSTGIEIIELTNGCVCCSVRGELTAALHDLLARRDAGTLLFDRLILETTGLADPAPVVQTFFTDATLRERLALDAVITLVDSAHAQRQLTEHRVAVSQVGFADRLVLTKIDSIDEEEKKLLIDRLRQINVRAPLIEADHGKLPRAAWLDLHAFDLDPSLPIDQTLLSRQTSPTFTAAPSPTLFKRSWSDNITSHVLTAGSLDLTRVGAWMEQLIAEHGNDMLRYKGIFAITDESRRLIVQGVHKVVGFDYGPEWRADELPASLLVVISRNLPIDTLKVSFTDCTGPGQQI